MNSVLSADVVWSWSMKSAVSADIVWVYKVQSSLIMECQLLYKYSKYSQHIPIDLFSKIMSKHLHRNQHCNERDDVIKISSCLHERHNVYFSITAVSFYSSKYLALKQQTILGCSIFTMSFSETSLCSCLNTHQLNHKWLYQTSKFYTFVWIFSLWIASVFLDN